MKTNQRKIIGTYSAMFLIAGLVTFAYFLICQKSLVWKLDGYSQHYVALSYYGDWLRTVFSNIFINHSFVVPMFDFNIGYGADILTTLNYYVIGDPLNLLSGFVPSAFTEYLYDFLVIFRLYLAGLFFVQFCNTIGLKGRRISLGGILYVFTGFTMYAAVRHPIFILPLIFFPLVLTGVEKVIREKKPFQLIIAVALSAISSFYFFYMIAIFTAIYALVRIVFTFKKDIKNIIFKLVKVGVSALIGISIAGILFYPVAMAVLGDMRVATSHEYIVRYQMLFYEKILAGFISYNYPGYWAVLGFTPLALLGVYFAFIKKNIQSIIFFIVCVVCISVPIIGSVLNGFSYISNRWLWAFGMLAAYLVVKYWDEIINLVVFKKKSLVILLGLYVSFILIRMDARTEATLVSIIILSVMLIVLLYMNVFKQKSDILKSKVVAVIALVAIMFTSFSIFAPSQHNYISEFVDATTVNSSHKDDYSFDIAKYTTPNGFERLSYEDSSFAYSPKSNTMLIAKDGVYKNLELIDTVYDIPSNSTLLSKNKGIGYYFSLINSNVSNYNDQMNNADCCNFAFEGIDSRPALMSLSSIKYYIAESTNTNVPFGFKKVKVFKKSNPYRLASKVLTPDTKKLHETKYVLYKNENYLPFGYTYDKSFSENKLNKLNGIQKERAMLEGAIVEDGTSKFDYREETVPFKIVPGSNIEMKNNCIHAKNNNSSVVLNYNCEEPCQLMVYLDGFKMVQNNPKDVFKKQIEGMSESDVQTINSLYYGWYPPLYSTVSFETEDYYKQIKMFNDTHPMYTDKQNYAINMRYSNTNRYSLKITFPERGKYYYKNIKIVKVKYDDYKDRINALKTETMKNVAVKDNEITGDIDLSKEKLLCMNVPYSKGWKLYVDNIQRDIKKVNYMYSGTRLCAGKHTIKLVYRTPNLIEGMYISLGGLGALILMIIFEFLLNKYRKRKQK